MIQTYTCLSILKLKLNFASVVQTKVDNWNVQINKVYVLH